MTTSGNNANSSRRNGLFFAVTPLAFTFSCPGTIDGAVSAINKLKHSEPPSQIALLQIDAETQRFHIATRALRSHLVEAKGYLRRIDDHTIEMMGEAYGESLSVPLLTMTIMAAIVITLVTANIIVAGIGLLAVLVTAAYSRQFVERVDADERVLVHMLEEAVHKPA